MDNAWMIRRDGKAIPCLVHTYGSKDALEETVYAAQWLCENSANAETRKLAFAMIAAYGASLNAHRNGIRNLLIAIKERPYVFLEEAFVRAHMEDIQMDLRYSLQELNDLVCQRLSQEFMRARIGGMYDTEEGNRELFFRISSDGFDWSGIITRFLTTQASRADTVTVVRDHESTGKFFYYCKQLPLPLEHPLPAIQ